MPAFERLKKKLRERKCESPIEAMVCDCLTRLHVKFRNQEPIGPYFADIYLPEWNAVIECDGREFHQDFKKESERDEFITNAGYRIYHMTGREIVNDPMEATFGLLKRMDRKETSKTYVQQFEFCPMRNGYYDLYGNEIEKSEESMEFSQE